MFYLKRLILLSASERRSDAHEGLTPLERFQGVYFRILKKYLNEGKLKNTDIIVVSDKFGILTSENQVPYHERFIQIPTPEEMEKLRKTNLQKLGQVFKVNKYSEIFVVCGKQFQQFISGFENLTEAKVTYCKGSGLGQKAQHLRQWILEHAK